MNNNILLKSLIILLLFSNNLVFSQEHPDYEIINQINTTSVKDQGMTGTCWSFATISFLETEFLRESGKNINLSEMYIVYNAYIEKAKYYVRLHGLGNFSQGGQAHDVINIATEYGFVPQEVYQGYVNNDTAYDHTILEKSLKNYLDSIIIINPIPENWLEGFKAILNKGIGLPPIDFSFENNTYSPLDFETEFMNFNEENYVEITSYNHHEFYTQFDLEVPDNWSHNEYYNVPVTDLITIIDNALNNGYSVCWDGDVSEKKFSHRKGFAVLNDYESKLLDTIGVQDLRQKTFENQTSTDDHLMHLTGIAKDKNGVIYYQTKNSWAADSNNFDGYLYMSEEFVEIKTTAILVNKKAIPDEIAKKMGIN